MSDPEAIADVPGDEAVRAEDPRGSGNRASVMRGASWTLVSIAVTTPVALVVSILVSRALGPSGYGQVAVLILALTVATQLAHLGYGTAAIRWGAAAWAGGDQQGFEVTLAKSLGYHTLFQAPVLCVVGVLFAGFNQPGLILPIVIGVSLPCVASSAALLLTMKSRTDQLAKATTVITVLVQTATLISATLSQRADVTWGWTLVVTGLGNLLLFVPLRRPERQVALSLKIPRRHPAGFIRFASLTGGVSLINTMVATRSEIFLLAAVAPGADTGRFALAFGIAAMLTAPVDALVGPLVPAAVGLVTTRPDAADGAYLRTLGVTSVFSGLTLAVAAPVVSVLVPLVYGQEFAMAQHLLIPLAAASCIVSACNPALVFLGAMGVAGTLLRRSIAALSVNVVLALSLIPLFGVWGAVAANAVTSLANSLPVIAAHRRRSGVSWRAILAELRPLGVALIIVVVFALTTALVGADRPLWSVCALVGAAVGWILGIRLLSARLDDETRELVLGGLPTRRLPWVGRLARGVVTVLT